MGMATTPPHHITPAQCRMARGALDISRATLAKLCRLSLSTITSMEKGLHVTHAATLNAARRAFEARDVVFQFDKDGNGVGVDFVDPERRAP